MKLQGKVVVITGSGGGSGEACAHRFTTEGAKVVVADIDQDSVERVSRAIGSVGLAADVTVEGHLLLETGACIRTITAGDVVHLRL